MIESSCWTPVESLSVESSLVLDPVATDRVLLPSLTLISPAQEFDTPLNLFSQEAGVFRSMCEKSRISREDIELATEGSL